MSTSTAPERPRKAASHNLPALRSSFVGREQEVAEVKRGLDVTRLLTLTGAGGSGKTRLALEVARDLLESYPDGVWLVELAPLSEKELVPQAVAKALGVPERPGELLTDTLAEVLRSQKLLVILDNCEHLVETVARFVDTMLDSCPQIRVLATSREALGVEGEVIWLVPPLSVPLGTFSSPEELEGYESARLFVERAGRHNKSFSLERQDAVWVAEICRRLEGIPLAIELAANRVGVLSVQQISEKLDESLKLLTGGARTAFSRQRTLRATLDWSYELLSELEKALFRRLSVCTGGWTLESAEEVGSDESVEKGEVLDLLSRLVEKSLVVATVTEQGGMRYRFLEPIRQCALEKLEESEAVEAVRDAHARYFLALVEEAESELKGPDQLEWLERLEVEYDNVRAALSWALEAGQAELGLRLAGAMWWFWLVRGYTSEGLRWLEGMLAKYDGPLAHVQAKALVGAGRLLLERGGPERATDLLAEGVTLFREAGLNQGLADSLDNLGIAWAYQGELTRAKTLFEESVELFREAGDMWGVAESLNNLALIAGIHNNREQEMALHNESLRIRRELGDKRGIVMSLINLAFMALKGGAYGQAANLCEEGLALGRALGDKGLTANLLINQGLALLNRGDSGRAMELFQGSLVVHQEMGDKYHLHSDLMSLASAAVMEKKPVRAARLFGAAQALRESTGIALVDVENGRFYERFVAEARSQIEEKAWERALQEGRAMSMQGATQYALSVEKSSTRPAAAEHSSASPSIPEHPAGLTPREGEVLVLVAEGLTNAQIAEKLFLSPRTVHRHLNSIYHKIGVSSRSAATRFALEHGLA
jgi:predicted ATPase/DNA-binding CsgD family transcriptional regulator